MTVTFVQNTASSLSTPRARRIFLCSAAVFGVVMVFLATSRYGGGVAGDSIHYLSVAENLLRGRGFVDYTGAPLILFPPLFAIIIAGLAWLFHVDVFIAGWCLNAVLFGLNIYLGGRVLEHVFETRPMYFYLAVIFTAFSPSALAMHASVLSDPPYLTFTLLFFLLGEKQLRGRDWGSLVGLLALAALSPVLRFSGLAQVIAGGLVVLAARWRQPLKAGLLAAFFMGLALLPVGLWIALHNLPLSGTWWGTTNAASADALANLLQSLRKMMYWFIPYRPLTAEGLVEPVVALAIFLIILLVLNRRSDWLSWVRELLHPALVTMLIFSAVYYSSTILNIRTEDHRALFSDRYFVILMVPLLALIFITLDKLVLPHLRMDAGIASRLVAVLFLVWCLYPGYRIAKYTRESLADGESGYNQYNTREYHQSQVLAQVNLLPQERLYSNIPPVVWFFSRREMTLPPTLEPRRTRDEIKNGLAGWPGDRPGYYIWFQPDPYKLFMPPDDLSLVADMEMTWQGADGAIVRVQARKGP